MEAFVLDGTIPTDDEERGDVAEWCITERLPEHFALVPATRLGIALGMRDVDEAAAECLGRANSLRDLILSMAVPTDGDGMATAIVAALQCPTLERLILADAAEMALEALRSALESNHGLKELELQWDQSYPHLALRDGTLLGEILQTHPPLNTLRLDGCNSGATGPVLAQLRTGCPLQKLQMNLLAFDNKQALDHWHENIAGMLSTNPPLHALDILGNPVTPRFLDALGMALRGNFRLRSLAFTVSDRKMERAMDAFCKLLAHNHGLTEIEIYGEVTDAQQWAIGEKIRLNKAEVFRSFMHGAGKAFAKALKLPEEAGPVIADQLLDTSTDDEFKRAGGPAALAMVNRKAGQMAVAQRSLDFRQKMVRMLAAEEVDVEGLAELCRSVPWVLVLPSDMDKLFKYAREQGKDDALKAAFAKAQDDEWQRCFASFAAPDPGRTLNRPAPAPGSCA